MGEYGSKSFNLRTLSWGSLIEDIISLESYDQLSSLFWVKI
jgi:hypothetical protein